MHGFFSAVSGGAAQELWLEKVSNNLANANSIGYKGDHPTFESLLVNRGGKNEAGGLTTPVALVTTEEGIDFRQGPVRQTGNSLDLAIEGEGFFVVDSPQGSRYTRSGNFTINDKGVLSTHNGLPVMSDKGEIALPRGEVVVTEDGSVMVGDANMGKLKIVGFDDNKALTKEGDNLFSLSGEGREVPVEDPRVVQGSVEASNVNVVAEMTMLINITRAYEAYQKVVRAMDEISGKAINEVGKIG